MNIIILGAGAIGSLFGAKLSGMNDVILIAKKEHAGAINKNGLRMTGLENKTYRIKAAGKIDKKRILFKKNLSVRDLVETYSKAKAMILPSYYEAFGKVLAESMSCETPVVSTRVGGVPEVVADCGYLTDYGEWKKFRHYVEVLLDDDSLRKRLGKKGRKRMQKNFDVDVIVNKLHNIYKRVI